MLSDSPNATCIYCGSAGPFAEEHAIPFCLGEFEGFSTLADRVCGPCNNTIGHLERHFCRGASPESFFRRILGIKGRKSHKPHNPFTDGIGGLEPIDVQIRDPDTRDSLLWEFLGPGEVRQVPQIVLRGENGTHSIRISATMKPEELRRRIEDAGYAVDKIDAYAVVSPDERPWVTSLLKGIGKTMEFPDEQRPPLRFSDWVKVDLQVGPKYFRAVAKIGFHYCLSVLHQLRGDEAEFQPLRAFIVEGGAVDSFVEQQRLIILRQIPVAYGHIALAMWEAACLKVYLQFFIGPDNPRPIAYCVKLSERLPGSLQDSGFVGHVFVYFPDGPHGRFRGKAIPLRACS